MPLRAEVVEIEEELRQTRRHLHMHPELKFEENKTAELIASRLREYGLDVITGIATTGVVGVLKGDLPGRCLALRADMDALPVIERDDPNKPYVSKNPGVMHACGHDAHIAILLGAAKIVSKWKKDLKGSIKFIFQPGEEGGAGARLMINEGVLTTQIGGVSVDEIYGLHVFNSQDLGTVGVAEGAIMAASDPIEIKVIGRGGHGSQPHESSDAIVAASTLVLALQQIVSRNVNPNDAAVVTIGTMNGGYARNVIADVVTLSGTMRTLQTQTRELLKRRINEIANGIAIASGVKIETNLPDGYPPTINSAEGALAVQKAATAIVGANKVSAPIKTLAAEDFSFFLQERLGAFFFVGSSPSPAPTQHPHHSPQFDIDESCLGIGCSVFVQLVENLLRS